MLQSHLEVPKGNLRQREGETWVGQGRGSGKGSRIRCRVGEENRREAQRAKRIKGNMQFLGVWGRRTL